MSDEKAGENRDEAIRLQCLSLALGFPLPMIGPHGLDRAKRYFEFIKNTKPAQTNGD